MQPPPPVDEPPKKTLPKFLNELTRKSKDRGVETQAQPELQTSAGAESRRPLQPPLASTPQELSAKYKGKQKQSDPDATPLDDTNYAPIPIPEPKPATSVPRTGHTARSRDGDIRQATMRCRDGSAAQTHDRLEVPPVALGHVDEVCSRATSRSIPRRWYMAKLQKMEADAQAADPSTVATTSQITPYANIYIYDDSDSEEASDYGDREAHWWKVLFYLICYCARASFPSLVFPLHW
ncbi:hypothetical protein PAXRUDRAFT_676364 [Paxillus rubicundulus Ve08.2h10]|uniref:Uncharacterized protein n=1 Tax=Paxillus rubicundulus Ve08.2h10 TaxID=930991 RepID=A0A0D0DWN6_9AGAM|nr:hypothetical protein PAXRUDRAFT_676364 [Paxillus rubicundulus Ve08.2h10]